MKNTVSFETASRLKAAGFPQPEPESGQVWHHKDGSIFIIVFNGSEKVDYVPSHAMMTMPIVCREYKKYFLADQVFFAPTATDILPSECFICREISYKTKTGERWVVYDRDTLELLCKDFPESDNPAESAAAAWLEIHEKYAERSNQI